MGIGGGGLEAMATYELTTAVQKTQKSVPSEKSKEAIANSIGEVDSSQSKVNPEELIKVVDKLNKTSDLYNQGLRFKVHEGTERLMVQIVNEDSGEVIKEIPPEKVLDMEASIRQIVGLIIDKKA